MATSRNQRVPRLLQPLEQEGRSTTADLVLELALVRAAAVTMAEALGAIAIASTDAEVSAFALDALTRAEQIMS